MTDARAQILARIAAAVGSDPVVEVPLRSYHGQGTILVADPAALLEERLLDYHARVHRCPHREVPDVISSALAERQAVDVVIPTGFPAEWLPKGLEPDAVPRDVAALDNSDAVLTSCRLAIATTGTIVLDAGPGQGARSQTLVPDYHLVVVRADQIVVTVPDAIHLLDPTAPLTWISGPSATSDIELDRVEGVHGPRTLGVVIAVG